jgi:hypothetical protein
LGNQGCDDELSKEDGESDAEHAVLGIEDVGYRAPGAETPGAVYQ